MCDQTTPTQYCVFPAVMKFMGDFPLKGQTEQDLVTAILKVHMSHMSAVILTAIVVNIHVPPHVCSSCS